MQMNLDYSLLFINGSWIKKINLMAEMDQENTNDAVWAIHLDIIFTRGFKQNSFQDTSHASKRSILK